MFLLNEKWLKYGHLGAGLVHFSQGLFGELYVNVVKRDDKVDFPLTNSSYVNGGLVNTLNVNFDIRQLVPLFSFLSSVNHFYSYHNFDSYLKRVDNDGYNPVKWGEYSFSAGLMNVLVSMLSGVSDVKVLFNQFVLNVGLQFSGYMSEKLMGESFSMRKTRSVNNGKPTETHPASNGIAFGKDIRSLQRQAKQQNVLGFSLFVGILMPIWTSFVTSITESTQDAPNTIYIIIVLITLFYLSFGVLHSLYLYWDKLEGRFRNVEFGYIVLSLTSKSFLTYMTLFGTTRNE